jgi:hypothetical protein
VRLEGRFLEFGDGGWAVSFYVCIIYVLILFSIVLCSLSSVLFYAADTEFLFDTVERK